MIIAGALDILLPMASTALILLKRPPGQQIALGSLLGPALLVLTGLGLLAGIGLGRVLGFLVSGLLLLVIPVGVLTQDDSPAAIAFGVGILAAMAALNFAASLVSSKRREEKRLELVSEEAKRSGSFKYRAFISYSHEDGDCARRLHKELESYRVPNELVGHKGQNGLVPPNLYPVFRDREELTSSADLSAEIRDALEKSAYLIVVCSPSAAASRWVNEEILYFRRLGRGHHILTMIADREPRGGHSDQTLPECFPDALGREFGADGELLRDVAEPLAVDPRPGADGKRGAVLKLIAGLLGVGYEELNRRELEAQHRRVRRYVLVIAALALTTVAAAAGGVLSHLYLARSKAATESAVVLASRFLEQEIMLSRQMGVTQHTIESVLTRSESQMDELYRSLHVRGIDEPGLQLQRAIGLHMLSEHYRMIGDSARERSRAEHAHSLLQGLVDRYPKEMTYRRNLALAKMRIGQALAAQGEADGALESLRSSLTILQVLMGRYPDAVTMARDEAGANLSDHAAIVERAIADVLWAQGKVTPALESYSACLLRLQDLVRSNPEHVGWKYDLAISDMKVGDVFLSQGELKGALDAYQVSVDTLQHLVVLAPDDTLWQRDLAASYTKIGDTLQIARQYPSAEHSYRMGLIYAERLASSDPGNARWQSDLAAIDRKMGTLCVAQEQLERAATFHRNGLEIAARLAAHNPRNEEWQREAMLSHNRYGDMWLASGKPEEGLEQYQQGVAIAQRMAAANPGSVNWQDELGLSYLGLANVERALGNAVAADAAVLQASAIYQRLVQKSPAHKLWAFHRDLAETAVRARQIRRQ